MYRVQPYFSHTEAQPTRPSFLVTRANSMVITATVIIVSTILLILILTQVPDKIAQKLEVKFGYGDRYFGCTDECYRNKQICLSKVKDYGNSQKTRSWYRKCSGIYIKLCIAVYRNCLEMCDIVRHEKPRHILHLVIQLQVLPPPQRFRIRRTTDGIDPWKPWTEAFGLCNQLVR